MNRNQSTSAGTTRRPSVIIDMTVERPVNPAMSGFFDTLATSASDLLKNAAGTFTTGAINTQLELEKIKAQAKIDAARRAAEAAANPTNAQPVYIQAGVVPWYQEPKVMLPLAAALVLGLYLIRKRRGR